jgi:propionaldehyde dehydrogenase
MGMKSGKKVIGAGAGNPPCIVDETADLVKAAEDIINGASFDYNLPCIAEKSLIVVESVAERLVQQMQSFGALLLSPADTDKLRAACLPEGRPIKNWSVKARHHAGSGRDRRSGESAASADSARQRRRPVGHQRAADADAAGRESRDFDSALALALKVEEGCITPPLCTRKMSRA